MAQGVGGKRTRQGEVGVGGGEGRERERERERDSSKLATFGRISFCIYITSFARGKLILLPPVDTI